VLLQLANALGGDVVLGGQVVQRRLLLGQPALVKDVAAALVQAFQRLVQAGIGTVAPVGVLQLAGRVVTMVFQIVGRGLVGGVVVGIGGRVEGHVLARQAALH